MVGPSGREVPLLLSGRGRQTAERHFGRRHDRARPQCRRVRSAAAAHAEIAADSDTNGRPHGRWIATSNRADQFVAIAKSTFGDEPASLAATAQGIAGAWVCATDCRALPRSDDAENIAGILEACG